MSLTCPNPNSDPISDPNPTPNPNCNFKRLSFGTFRHQLVGECNNGQKRLKGCMTIQGNRCEKTVACLFFNLFEEHPKQKCKRGQKRSEGGRVSASSLHSLLKFQTVIGVCPVWPAWSGCCFLSGGHTRGLPGAGLETSGLPEERRKRRRGLREDCLERRREAGHGADCRAALVSTSRSLTARCSHSILDLLLPGETNTLFCMVAGGCKLLGVCSLNAVGRRCKLCEQVAGHPSRGHGAACFIRCAICSPMA
eukprot:3994086-Pleurochrysis_carterae.AAC.2